MSKRKQQWSAGDNFVVPLVDGSYGQGQVISYEADAMNSTLCAFFSNRYPLLPETLVRPRHEDMISMLFVTRDLLDSGIWKVIDNGPCMSPSPYVDLAEARSKGFVGTTITGSSNARTLLNAYHKLVPWDKFYNPRYLDELLLPEVKRPPNVLLKGDAPEADPNSGSKGNTHS